MFEKRIVVKNNIYYLLVSFDIPSNVFKCIRLYDKNGIKINIDYYYQKNVFQNFLMKDLLEKFQILTNEESQNILTEYHNSQNILKVIYKTVESNEIENIAYVYFRQEKSVIQPFKAFPEHIDLKDYKVETLVSSISDVKTKEDNLKVLFTAEEGKDEWDLLPNEIELFTSQYKRTLNVIHLHGLNDALTFQNIEGVYSLEQTNNNEIFSNIQENVLLLLIRHNKVNID